MLFLKAFGLFQGKVKYFSRFLPKKAHFSRFSRISRSGPIFPGFPGAVGTLEIVQLMFGKTGLVWTEASDLILGNFGTRKHNLPTENLHTQATFHSLQQTRISLLSRFASESSAI